MAQSEIPIKNSNFNNTKDSSAGGEEMPGMAAKSYIGFLVRDGRLDKSYDELARSNLSQIIRPPAGVLYK